MKYLVPIDMNKNELQNARTHNLASAPGSPALGQRYYNTTNNVEYYWNGTAWVPTDAVAASNIPNSALATNPLDRANHTGTQAANTISDLATVVKAYRLDEFAVPTASVSMNTQKITNLAAPTAGSNDAARIIDVENAVQSAAAGIDAKPSVRAASTANIASLSAPQTIDGVSVIAGDRVLVKNQSTASANGVYVVAAGAWTRALTEDNTTELTPGAFWFVEEGTTQGKTQWRIENTGAIVVGTTGITINQFGATNNYTAGNGLSLTGNDFAVGAGTGISVAADTVAIDTAVVARKFSQTFGDGAQTSFTITHNLNNQDAMVSVRDAATNQVVVCDVQNNGANTVILSFAAIVASNALRVTVIG